MITHWQAKEYCVEGEPGQPYCANPCTSNASCALSYWCVPLRDEGTPWATDGLDMRWVCMPDHYFTGLNRVFYWGETSCASAVEDECPIDMRCIDYETDTKHEYFCSDTCTTNDSCIGGCCYEMISNSYCLPRDSFCN